MNIKIELFNKKKICLLISLFVGIPRGLIPASLPGMLNGSLMTKSADCVNHVKTSRLNRALAEKSGPC